MRGAVEGLVGVGLQLGGAPVVVGRVRRGAPRASLVDPADLEEGISVHLNLLYTAGRPLS